MVSRVYTYLTIGIWLTKVSVAVAERVQESTPEERTEIAQHIAAIYRILRDATERSGDAKDFPMLMLGPATHKDSHNRRMERLQDGIGQFRYTFRRYKRHLSKENRGQVRSHVRELARIVSEIEARVRV